jgi:16S rRNA (cytidine1402-2'-O)-methyltransferase
MTKGTLYIVATPIGNLEDITLRAIRVLKEVDAIAAEDTRHTQKLLNKFDIHTPLTSYHDHNKEEKAPVLVARLLEGKSVALVSDAGTPGISDPGYFLINLAIDQNIPVVPIPGATAAIAALSVSGLPTDRFVFEGFLPSKHAARVKRLEELVREERTIIFYEAPHRIIPALEDMQTVLGDRKAVLTRELTKVHEQVLRGSLSEVRKQLEAGSMKGEYTIIIEAHASGANRVEISPEEYLKNLILHRGLSRKEAIAVTAHDLDMPKKEIYKIGLTLKEED